MNKLQELMCISMEECGELVQSCSKIMRWSESFDSINEDNLNNLKTEAGDVYAMIMLMKKFGLFSQEDLDERMEVKYNKLKTWSELFK